MENKDTSTQNRDHSTYFQKSLLRMQETGRKPAFPVGAFCLFSQVRRPQMKQEDHKLTGKQISKFLKKEWAQLKTRQPYLEQAQDNYRYYKKLLKLWNNSSFNTNSSGLQLKATQGNSEPASDPRPPPTQTLNRSVTCHEANIRQRELQTPAPKYNKQIQSSSFEESSLRLQLQLPGGPQEASRDPVEGLQVSKLRYEVKIEGSKIRIVAHGQFQNNNFSNQQKILEGQAKEYFNKSKIAERVQQEAEQKQPQVGEGGQHMAMSREKVPVPVRSRSYSLKSIVLQSDADWVLPKKLSLRKQLRRCDSCPELLLADL